MYQIIQEQCYYHLQKRSVYDMAAKNLITCEVVQHHIKLRGRRENVIRVHQKVVAYLDHRRLRAFEERDAVTMKERVRIL